MSSKNVTLMEKIRFSLKNTLEDYESEGRHCKKLPNTVKAVFSKIWKDVILSKTGVEACLELKHFAKIVNG